MKRWSWMVAAVGVLAVAWWSPRRGEARDLSSMFTTPVAQDGGSQFATGQVALSSTTGTLVRAANTTRRRLILFNPSANDVAIGTGTAIGFGNGYVIPAGVERTFYHAAAVYAIRADSATATISWEEDQQ